MTLEMNVMISDLVCVDIGRNGIMFNYERHFNKTKILHLRFNNGRLLLSLFIIDVLITFSGDYIPPLGVLGALDAAFNGGAVEPNLQYKRTEDFGCCQEESTNTALIIGIVIGSVVIIAAVVITLVVVFKPSKKQLPKTQV